jgi:hypothetical protein
MERSAHRRTPPLEMLQIVDQCIGSVLGIFSRCATDRVGQYDLLSHWRTALARRRSPDCSFRLLRSYPPQYAAAMTQEEVTSCHRVGSHIVFRLGMHKEVWHDFEPALFGILVDRNFAQLHKSFCSGRYSTGDTGAVNGRRRTGNQWRWWL